MLDELITRFDLPGARLLHECFRTYEAENKAVPIAKEDSVVKTMWRLRILLHDLSSCLRKADVEVTEDDELKVAILLGLIAGNKEHLRLVSASDFLFNYLRSSSLAALKLNLNHPDSTVQEARERVAKWLDSRLEQARKEAKIVLTPDERNRILVAMQHCIDEYERKTAPKATV